MNPKGVFSLTPADQVVSSGALNNPDVSGISIRTHWDALETADGVYNWTYLDSQAQRCCKFGKQISLRVGTGSGGATISGGNVPDWVMKLVGGATFAFIDLNSGGIKRKIPTFWNDAF